MTTTDAIVYSQVAGRLGLAPVAGWGYRRHLATGETPRAAYRAMRKLYGCASPEPFQRMIDRAALEHPLLDLAPDPAGLAQGHVEDLVAALRADGMAVLPERLDEAACAELEAVATSAQCVMIDGPDISPGARGRWDPAAPKAVRYDLEEPDIVAAPAAQRILADASLLSVAQAYLGAAPIVDLVAMWWSSTVGGGSSAVAAQQYHFDLDRLRFLKLFVYLTDVDERTGPHVYVRGSHATKPAHLRHDGRHSDVEVESAYPGKAEHLVGPRGTMFLADTVGMHKGLGLDRGHRLVFQVEWTTSLFGAPFNRPTLTTVVPELASIAAEHPWTYQRFGLAGHQ